MAKIRGEGLNREKFIFLLAFGALGGGIAFFLWTWPGDFQAGQPTTAKGDPKKYRVTEYLLKASAEEILQGDRKSPFTPHEWIASKITTPTTPKSVPDEIPIPPQPKPEEKKNLKKNSEPTEKDLEVAFMGVVSFGDKVFGLLKNKDGSEPIQVKTGDVLEGLNYKITGIDPQAIHLVDDEGRPYTLKDNRFDPKAGKTKTPKDKKPSFVDGEDEAPTKPKTPIRKDPPKKPKKGNLPTPPQERPAPPTPPAEKPNHGLRDHGRVRPDRHDRLGKTKDEF